ncbi:MAG TPA: hypothetical protein VI670_07155 [Thermoanaerobaculia bacterium]
MLILTLPAAARGYLWPAEPEGSINGRIAMMGIPSDVSANEARRDGTCNVYLAKLGLETLVDVHPCGAWFQPAVGRYMYWIERADGISVQSALNYGGEEFRQRGAVFPKRLFQAGTVKLSATAAFPRGGELRVVSLSPGDARRPFDRRVAFAAAHLPLRVPAGKLLAGLFDGKGNALALTPPLTVTAEGTTLLQPKPPKSGKAALLAVFNRPGAVDRPQACQATLVAGRRRLSPAADLQAIDRLIFAWYDVPPERASMQIRCGSNHYEKDVKLLSNAIVTVREVARFGGR